MKLEILAMILLLGLSSAHAETDFNDCKAVKALEERLSCLKQASETFHESSDSLTPKVFRLGHQSWTYQVGIELIDGMLFEEPNNINSGQTFTTVFKPSVGFS